MDEVAIDFAHLDSKMPIFLCGDCLNILPKIPDESIDCVLTSPPYYGQRIYGNGGIGNEENLSDYLAHLLLVCSQIWRVLKPSGSFWINIGDSYQEKTLLNIPGRLAIALTEKGWVERNEVVWHKIRGGLDSQEDRLRNTHEMIFHFTKASCHYYYDSESIRLSPKEGFLKSGKPISATGVTGKKYWEKIEKSTSLTYREKRKAKAALKDVLRRIKTGELSDFRMVIRDEEKPTHSANTSVSGRAEELEKKGFYFLLYNPLGPRPGDVWDIASDDGGVSKGFSASFPLELCRIPLLATCPPEGIVLDPFSGLGTTNLAAFLQGKKSVGIEINPAYIDIAKKRFEK